MIDYKLSTFSRNITFFSQIKVYAISQKKKVKKLIGFKFLLWQSWNSCFKTRQFISAVVFHGKLYNFRSLREFFFICYFTSAPLTRIKTNHLFSVWSCLIWQSNVVIRRKINEITCSHPLLIQVRLTASHKTR